MLCVVNLDPHHAQEGAVVVPDALGLGSRFEVLDRLTGERFEWGTGDNYVRLAPGERPAHVLAVHP